MDGKIFIFLFTCDHLAYNRGSKEFYYTHCHFNIHIQWPITYKYHAVKRHRFESLLLTGCRYKFLPVVAHLLVTDFILRSLSKSISFVCYLCTCFLWGIHTSGQIISCRVCITRAPVLATKIPDCQWSSRRSFHLCCACLNYSICQFPSSFKVADKA